MHTNVQTAYGADHSVPPMSRRIAICESATQSSYSFKPAQQQLLRSLIGRNATNCAALLHLAWQHPGKNGNGHSKQRVEMSAYIQAVRLPGLCHVLHSLHLEHSGRTGPSRTRSMKVLVRCKLTMMRGSCPEQGKKAGHQRKLVLLG